MPHKIPLLLTSFQRKGILFFLILLLAVFLVVFLWARRPNSELHFDLETMAAWEAHYQKLQEQTKAAQTKYQYNPNFLSAYRAYLFRSFSRSIRSVKSCAQTRGKKLYARAISAAYRNRQQHNDTNSSPFKIFYTPSIF